MKSKLVILTSGLLFFILFSTVTVYGQQINFSGKWALNSEKSDFAGYEYSPAIIFNKTIIEQKADSIYLISVGDNGEADRSHIAKYPLDGTPTEKIADDTIKVRGAFQWSEDKKQLVKNQTYYSTNTPNQPLVTMKQTWSLSDDGKELTIEQTQKAFDSRNPSYTIKAVYDKQ
jgi:hypothetical protein